MHQIISRVEHQGVGMDHWRTSKWKSTTSLATSRARKANQIKLCSVATQSTHQSHPLVFEAFNCHCPGTLYFGSWKHLKVDPTQSLTDPEHLCNNRDLPRSRTTPDGPKKGDGPGRWSQPLFPICPLSCGCSRKALLQQKEE